jgi:ABC-type antimicrobial peptide transport system permease subunit
MSYAVARRTAEIGIRMALGARVRTVVGMLMCESGGIVALGALLGLAGALVATRALSGLLFGLTVSDPQTITVSVLLLVLAATLAGYLAARRAARIDPIVALRYE